MIHLFSGRQVEKHYDSDIVGLQMDVDKSGIRLREGFYLRISFFKCSCNPQRTIMSPA
jgi:hypothetical protein